MSETGGHSIPTSGTHLEMTGMTGMTVGMGSMTPEGYQMFGGGGGVGPENNQFVSLASVFAKPARNQQDP